MIIKNNYNAKSMDPLNDYNSIGKGSHSLDIELDREREGFIRDNMKDPVLQKMRDEGKEKDEEITNNEWDFFK